VVGALRLGAGGALGDDTRDRCEAASWRDGRRSKARDAAAQACFASASMKTWSTDLRHLPADDSPAAARAAQRLGEHFRALAEAATSRRAGPAWRSAVRCLGHVGRKRCTGWLDVAYTPDYRVEWSCGVCGDSGVISGVAGSPSDMSGYVPRGKTRLWGYDEVERKVLGPATTHLPHLRAVLARGTPRDNIRGLILVEASPAELDEMYTLVEELTDMTRSQARIEVLDGLRASLCSAIDDF